MKFIALISVLSSLLFSYQVDDSLSMDIQKKLDMNDNKIYIIDFFASWCHSCEKEIPYISKVHQQLDSKKVEIIGIDVDKDINKAIAFQEKLTSANNLTFRVINDPENIIIKKFKPIGMPALFYVQDAKVIHVIYGAVDHIDEVILNDLEELAK